MEERQGDMLKATYSECQLFIMDVCVYMCACTRIAYSNELERYIYVGFSGSRKCHNDAGKKRKFEYVFKRQYWQTNKALTMMKLT